MDNNIKVITTNLPTYMEVFLQPQGKIKLCYEEKIKQLRRISSTRSDESFKNEEDSILELTGTPLETDLGESDSIEFDVKRETSPHWSPLEAEQYSVDLNTGRRFLNEYFRNNRNFGTTLCLCDGKDPKGTVVTGTFKSAPLKYNTFWVSVLPCCVENDPETSLPFMEKEHLKHVKCEAQIKTETMKLFNIVGHNLKYSSSLKDSENNGHISLQILTSEIDGLPTSQAQINVQVIVGHQASPLINFWEELCLIQSFIKILESGKLSETTSLNNKDFDLDSDKTNCLLKEIVATMSIPRKKFFESGDLGNLRVYQMLDKLWETLKKCGTVSDLCNSLCFLFEELADSERKVQLFNEDKLAVADLINAILDGKVAVPTLSFSQSLEVLIELGIQKLRNDYIAIFSGPYGLLKEKALKLWSELNDEAWGDKTKAQRRMTRVDLKDKSIVDLSISKLKLSYLVTMHKVSEFIFLVKDNLPTLKEYFCSFCEELCNEFLQRFKRVLVLLDMKQPSLCEFSSKISLMDVNSISKELIAQSIKFLSSGDFGEVETVFHLSVYPIFPPSVYEDYNAILDAESILYRSKMVKLTR